MLKYWLKNRAIFSSILSFVVGILISVAFVPNIITSYASAENEVSLYTKTDIDFDVPSPGFSQVAELEELLHIDNVTPYYFNSSSTSFNKKQVSNVNILLFHNIQSLNKSMYNSERSIIESQVMPENPLFIDYSFSKKLGLKLSDKLQFNFISTLVTFEVAGIFENNNYYQGSTVAALWIGEQKTVTEQGLGGPLKYSGAYIESNNIDATSSYLNSEYKPFGRLRNSDEFATEEAYQTHYNAFMSANYSNEITNFRTREVSSAQSSADYKKSGNLNLITVIALIIISQVVFNVAMVFRKTELKYFKAKKRLGAKYSPYLVLNFLSEFLLGAIILAVSTFIVSNTSSTFITDSIKTTVLFALLAGQFLGALLSFIASHVIINKAS